VKRVSDAWAIAVLIVGGLVFGYSAFMEFGW
jgi:hypothetical protein